MTRPHDEPTLHIDGRAGPSAAAWRTASAALLFCLAAGHAAAADGADEAAAVPYRPSVSTPAALSRPGWIEVEAGLQHQHDGGGARRDSAPVTLKLAFTPDWGIRVGGDAWVRTRDGAGGRDSGVGDTGIVVKRRFAVDDAQAFGLEAGVVVPTARHGAGSGSGKPDYGVNAIYSADFGAWHTDLNIVATRLGAVAPDAGRTQWLGAASLSHALDERWGAVAEISATRQRGQADTLQLLTALSYNVSKRLVLDAGAARSLRSGAPVWSAFAGFTWLAARLF
ncbi:MAG: transporter [Caldimonas sp.]